MTRATTSERLWLRLRAMGLGDRCGVGLRPLRPSRASRAAGAWSWAAVDERGFPLGLGSHHPMAELLAADRLVATRDTANPQGDIEIDMVLAPFPDEFPVGEWAWTYPGQALLERKG